MASAESRDIVDKLPARSIKKIYKAKPRKRRGEYDEHDDDEAEQLQHINDEYK